jgi:centrosomal protein CEP76
VKGKDPKAEDNDFVVPRKAQWFDKEKTVRIFDGGKSVGGTELTGSQLKSTGSKVPLIFFEAYFYPDDNWPAKFDWHKGGAKNGLDKWKEKEKQWRNERKEFQKFYKQAFPESIGALPSRIDEGLGVRNERARRFYCLAENQSLVKVPLPSFLVKIITPEEYVCAPWLLHWMNCFSFWSDSRQSKTGFVEKWNDPQMMLFAKRGTPQDHAILLCSILLGTKKDAYVVKGMVWQPEKEMFEKKSKKGAKRIGKKEDEIKYKLCEHVWVMTREVNDWVTFWEPCTREIYHLPQRYKEARAKKVRDDAKKAALKLKKTDSLAVVGEEEAEEDPEALEEVREELWTDEVPDVALGAEDIEQLPTIGRTARPKVKVAKKLDSASEKMKAALMAQRERLAIAPVRRLMDPESTLVDWLPYHSIEVVFNTENVWANHQHHHPACITYDLEDSTIWPSLLKTDKDKEEFKIEYQQQDVVMDPVAAAKVLKKMENDTITEMQENMRLNRRNRGLDSVFDLSDKMKEYCDLFLTIHENMRRLDVDMCPIWDLKEDQWTEAQCYVFKLLQNKRPYNKWGSAFQFDDYYVSKEKDGWNEIFTSVEEFIAMKSDFPARRGKDFDGFPVHFSTADRDDMRKYLMQLPGYTAILEDEQEDTAFVVHCKMWGLLDQIPSVWLYFGKHAPQNTKTRVSI